MMLARALVAAAVGAALVGCSDERSDAPNPPGVGKPQPGKSDPSADQATKRQTPEKGKPKAPTKGRAENELPPVLPTVAGTLRVPATPLPTVEPKPKFLLKGTDYGGFVDGEELAYVHLALEEGRPAPDPIAAFGEVSVGIETESPEVCVPGKARLERDGIVFGITRKGKFGATCFLKVSAKLGEQSDEKGLFLQVLDPELVRASATPRSFRFQSSGHSSDIIGRAVDLQSGTPGPRCLLESATTGYPSPQAGISPVRSTGGSLKHDSAMPFLLARDGVVDESRERTAKKFYDEVFPASGAARVFGSLFQFEYGHSHLGSPWEPGIKRGDATYRACSKGVASQLHWGYKFSVLLRFRAFEAEDVYELDLSRIGSEDSAAFEYFARSLRGRGEVGLVVAQLGGAIPEVDEILESTTCSLVNLKSCLLDYKRILHAVAAFEHSPRSMSIADLRASPLAVTDVSVSDGASFLFYKE